MCKLKNVSVGEQAIQYMYWVIFVLFIAENIMFGV